MSASTASGLPSGIRSDTSVHPVVSTTVETQEAGPLTGSSYAKGPRLGRMMGHCFLGLPTSTWLLFDLAILVGALAQGFSLFPPPLLERTPHIALWQAVAVLAFSFVVTSHVFGLYGRDTLHSRSRIMTRMFLAIAVAAIVAYAIIYVIMYATVSRRVAALALGLSFVVGTLARLGACWVIRYVPRRLLVVGDRGLYDSFDSAMKSGLLPEYSLVGYSDPNKDSQRADGRAPEFIGPIREQVTGLDSLSVTDIVVGDRASREPDAMNWIVPALQRGCRVTSEAIFYEKMAGQILVDAITPSWFLFADLKVHCDRHATVQRGVDLVAAIVGLCLTAPIWPLVALVIKPCDRGPVFYSQDRVGQNGRVFKLHKFRTMRVDAENGKSVWASPNDPRVTPVGRFLRRTRLDELPQLYNVLIGQMSIVGPRPERPDIVAELRGKIPFYDERHLVKPGITGWAQISFRYGASIEDSKRKLQFDLYYLKHMSFELDAIIVLRTIGTFLKGAC